MNREIMFIYNMYVCEVDICTSQRHALPLDFDLLSYMYSICLLMSLFRIKISDIVVPAPEKEIVVETEPVQFASGMC